MEQENLASAYLDGSQVDLRAREPDSQRARDQESMKAKEQESQRPRELGC